MSGDRRRTIRTPTDQPASAIAFGLRPRLLLAFGAISLFVVIAAAAGFYGLFEVSSALQKITKKAVPPALAASELARQTENIVAAGPALLNAGSPDEVASTSHSMMVGLAGAAKIVAGLADAGLDAATLDDISDVIAKVSDNLSLLQQTAGDTIAAEANVKTLMEATFAAYRGFDRISRPRFDDLRNRVVGLQRALTSPTEAQRQRRVELENFDQAMLALFSLEQIRREATTTFEIIIRASRTTDTGELTELERQAQRSIRAIDALVSDIDLDLSTELFEPISRLRNDVRGADNIFLVKNKAVEATARSRHLVQENAALSDRLREAVSRLVTGSRGEIEVTSGDAYAVQRFGRNVLLAVTALALISSVLIVWLYVGRNIVARLTGLSKAMNAIAGGARDVAIPRTGSDEVAAMGEAVEVFRRNAVDLDALLVERAQAAARLERLVEERTAELASREAALRVMFDSMSQGVAMFDGERKLVAWNRRFGDLFPLPEGLRRGVTRFDDFIRFLAESREFGTGNVEEIVRERVAAADQAYHAERTRPDGTVLDIRRNPVPGGGFISMYADITDVKRREQELEAARDVADTAYMELKAAQANLVHAEKMASLGQLTAGIAHEIKNPLNFVNNFSSLSRELLAELREALESTNTALGPSRRDEVEELIATLSGNLAKIAEHGQRADGIVKSMLLHSRGGSGDLQAADLNGLIEEALNLAYHGARAQDQTFNVALERDLDPAIGKLAVVPQDLTRVFLNLFSNSFYATNKRARDGAGSSYRPTVKVTTRAAADTVEIRIRDNGIGMTADVRKKLFTPFFTTKPTGEGTGLGLSISYDIVVQQHNGTMVVESAAGEYTEFIIKLPRSAVVDNVRRALGGSA
ncbi:MAG TPA: PAS-domain containing protein [Alphaproteobacteria bacterium]